MVFIWKKILFFLRKHISFILRSPPFFLNVKKILYCIYEFLLDILYLSKIYLGGWKINGKTLHPLNSNSPSPSPLAPGDYQATLLLTVLGASCRCSHAPFFLLWLACFTEHNVLQVRLWSHIWQDFLFFKKKLINIHCMSMPHFLYALPTDGHSGCFHSLAIVNNACLLFWMKYQVALSSVTFFKGNPTVNWFPEPQFLKAVTFRHPPPVCLSDLPVLLCISPAFQLDQGQVIYFNPWAVKSSATHPFPSPEVRSSVSHLCFHMKDTHGRYKMQEGFTRVR